MTRQHSLLAFSILLSTLPALAQTPGETAPPTIPPAAPISQSDPPKPLPEINTLMHDVERNQHAAEALQRDYIYRSFIQTDTTDSNGKPKKSETEESEVFWIDGIRITRRLKTDGKDLSEDEKRKQSERIDKRIAEIKAKRAKASASSTDPHGSDELSLARILELGAFSNERRELYKGRPAILVDYTGDPKAKTHNPLEGAFKELGGTVWVDEQDHMIAHIEGGFLNDFKLGGGLLVDVHKGTTFKADSAKINDEVWLPATFEGRGSARFLLFVNMHGAQFGRMGDYRKFKATSTILPGVTAVPTEPPPPPLAATPPAPPPSLHEELGSSRDYGRFAQALWYGPSIFKSFHSSGVRLRGSSLQAWVARSPTCSGQRWIDPSLLEVASQRPRGLNTASVSPL